MAKGDGSIIARGRGVWEVQLSFGKDALTGKYRKVTRTVRGTKADARKVRDQLRREHESGLLVDGAKQTFSEFAHSWHEARVIAGDVGKSHLERERQILNDLNSYIADVPLRDLTPQTIESLYTTIKRDKMSKLGKYSGTSLRMIHQVLKQIMQKAVDYDYILRNPCDRVNAPKADDPDRRSLTVKDGARLLSCINKAEAEAYKAMAEKESRQTHRGNLFGRECLRGLNLVGNVLAVRIGLATGMRRGEVFGLTWGNVALDQPCIKVRQSLTVYGELKAPKSKAGVRNIAIDAVTAAHLQHWKQRQAVELLKLGIKQSDETPVCCSEKGGLIDLHNFGRWWRQFRSQFDFDELRFHELRHTQATQLLANGVDVKTVQTRLGHSNASLTLNWYAHAIPENDEKAAQIVGELFDPQAQEPCIAQIKTA